jgi:PHD/YefM family antitoxin component YafN of YafNO toxin-antitoxin module
MKMPINTNITIRKSSDLRNSYNEISEYCRENNQPVFLTKNGEGDLAVMSIDLYNDLTARSTLYAELEKAEDDFKYGRTVSEEEAFSFMHDIRAKYKR